MVVVLALKDPGAVSLVRRVVHKDLLNLHGMPPKPSEFVPQRHVWTCFTVLVYGCCQVPFGVNYSL